MKSNYIVDDPNGTINDNKEDEIFRAITLFEREYEYENPFFFYLDISNTEEKEIDILTDSEKQMVNDRTEKYYSYFFENEMERSVEYNLIPPCPIVDRDSYWFGIPYIRDNHFAISTSLPFAIYKKETFEFIWIADNILRMMVGLFADKKFIGNVSLAEAEKLAIFFRTEWFINGIQYCYQSSGKRMETNNLVKFDISESLIIYALSDLGYNDPLIEN